MTLNRITNNFKGVFIIRRLQSDNKLSASGESFQFKQIKRSLKDWKTWVASKCVSYVAVWAFTQYI